MGILIWISAITLLLPLTTTESDICNPSPLPDPRTLRGDQLTVLISGFSEYRLPLLRSLAITYSTLPSVAAVLILWGNPSTPSQTLTLQLPFNSSAAPITVLRNPTSSLNHRFLPRREIGTRAVAVCDDDVEADPRSISLAFKIWKTHPNQAVGFFARSHDFDLDHKTWIYTVHPDRYSIVLTKFMILKTEYLHLYSCDPTLKEARRVVDVSSNCEDVLMNFVVGRESGMGPVLVEGRKVRDWGDSRNEVGSGKVEKVGLSSREGHRKRRGLCIREFHRVMGLMPLRYSYGKVVERVGEQGLCRKKGGKLVFCDRFS